MILISNSKAFVQQISLLSSFRLKLVSCKIFTFISPSQPAVRGSRPGSKVDIPSGSFGFLKLTFRVAQIPNCSNDLRILNLVVLLESVEVVLVENNNAGCVGTALLAGLVLPNQPS